MRGYNDTGFLQKETWLPMTLASYIERNNLIEEFELYLAIKLSCSGKIKANSSTFKSIRGLLNIRSRTTYYKRLEALKTLNWLGYNEASKYYFARGYERISKDLDLGYCEVLKVSFSTCVRFEIGCFENFRVFVFAAIICCKINHIKYAKQRNRKGNRLVPKYRDKGTNPSLSPTVLDYNGLSLPYISKITGKSESRCSELRKLAQEAGFLINKQKLLPIDIFPKNPYLRVALKEVYPNRFNRLKVSLIKKGEHLGMVQVYEQMENEILPMLKFRKR